jgi:phosphohistidine phosphatase
VPLRSLVLLRHAEAGPSGDGTDFGRPLTARGDAQARAVGAWLPAVVAPPGLVWCSSAARTKATLAHLSPYVADATVRVDAELYGAAPSTVLAGVHALDDEVATALVVFHNPAVAQLAAVLEPGPVRPYGVSPATAIVVRFDAPWSALCAELVDDFVVREGS